MAFDTGTIFRMTNFFEQSGNEALMVSYWRLSLMILPETPARMAEALQKHVMNTKRVKGAISLTAKATRTVIDNMTTEYEFGEYIGDDFGEVSGDPAPSFVTLSVKQIVPTRATRNGYKRIPFPSDSNTAGNLPQVSVSDKVAIEQLYGEETTVNYTGDGWATEFQIQPVVIGRTNIGTPAAPNYVVDMDKIQTVSSADLYKVTHQNSREV